MVKKLWGGRFKKEMDPEILQFTKSISYDKRLAPYDIEGSIAHAKMLGKCGIISKKDSARLLAGLSSLKNKLKKGELKVDEGAYEDIHTAITFLLKKEIGETADKLHTARSRNDQIALDIRMYCRDEIKNIQREINKLQQCFLAGAAKYDTATMPSYTHLKQAQCILLAHQLLAYIEMLERDKQRLQDAFTRTDSMPLGSVAHRGSTLPIDRFYVAKLLGFSQVCANSIDAVSDRDFVLEILSALAILSMHLSRVAEDFIIWSSDEFGFVEGNDGHYTGSSMMPNKKNPDPFELVRGYAGTLYGNLLSVFVMMKGLALSYNRDMQLDKPHLFDSIDTTKRMLTVLCTLFSGLKINTDKLRKACLNEYIFAADIAEYLVTKGYSWKQAHTIAGKMIMKSLHEHKPIKSFTNQELKAFSLHLHQKLLRSLLVPLESVRRVKSYGGTSPGSVQRQLRFWKKRLA